MESRFRKTSLSSQQKAALKHHMLSTFYDRNGTGEKKRILKRIFVPYDHRGYPQLILLCEYDNRKDRYGRFEYCIFSDGLNGPGHVPSDKFYYGTKKQALEVMKETIFGYIVGVWPWVINEAWKKTHKLLKENK